MVASNILRWYVGILYGHTTLISTYHTISWEYIQKDHFVRILYDVIGTFIASWFSLCEAKNTVLDLETLKMSGSQTKCTSLFAHWISTHGPPPGPSSPPIDFESSRHTSFWPGCLDGHSLDAKGACGLFVGCSAKKHWSKSRFLSGF